METDYIKDLRHNYMVISGIEDSNPEAYCIKLLEHQRIEGILGLEQRRLDDKILFYYDITSKQSLAAILDRTAFTEVNLRKLCQGIINTLESAYDYLLTEEDFILMPEYIYINVATNEPALCFLPGYSKPVKEQMSSLLEYLMNKVDYNDREAVLLVYRLYAVSREEGYTLTHLEQELTEPQKLGELPKPREEIKGCDTVTDLSYCDKQGIERKGLEHNSKLRNNGNQIVNTPESRNPKDISRNIPVMMEKITREVEVPCYPLKTYLFTGIGVAGGFLLILLGFISRIIYSTYGSRIDYSKLAALLLITFCCEGYIMKILWDKKNRITRIITENEYVDPNQINNTYTSGRYSKNEMHKPPIEKRSFSSGYEAVRPDTKAFRISDGSTTQVGQSSAERKAEIYGSDISTIENVNWRTDEKMIEYDNPTCLLNSPCQNIADAAPTMHSSECLFQSIDPEKYQSIPIVNFPFFIGKLKTNVDYCIDKDVVSRYHAKVMKEDSRYFIMDMNSTNGTYVNGIAIQTYEKREIKHGDEISFADIRYRVVIDSASN